MEGEEGPHSAPTPLTLTKPTSSNGPSPTGFGVSGEPEPPMLSQLYGFFASITAFVAAGIFVVWAYVPDYWLQYIGIDYYPSRVFALYINDKLETRTTQDELSKNESMIQDLLQNELL